MAVHASEGTASDSSHLKSLGIDLATLADPETRISHDVARTLLKSAIARTGNTAIGLLAGEQVGTTDVGVLHFAARNCPDLRSAVRCTARYLRLGDSVLEGVLTVA